MIEDAYQAGNPAHSGTRWLTVISGCSGSGKSSLLSELARRGYRVQPEPGRQIVKEQQSIGGDGLPWLNAAKFIELCISRAMFFFNTAEPNGRPVLFDRSIIDALAGYERLGLPLAPHMAELARRYRYAPRVFLAPPWPEIYANDAQRAHSFAEAEAEYHSLLEAYPAYGYSVVLIPPASVAERADFVEAHLR